jgi:hypothetical protein
VKTTHRTVPVFGLLPPNYPPQQPNSLSERHDSSTVAVVGRDPDAGCLFHCYSRAISLRPAITNDMTAIMGSLGHGMSLTGRRTGVFARSSNWRSRSGKCKNVTRTLGACPNQDVSSGRCVILPKALGGHKGGTWAANSWGSVPRIRFPYSARFSRRVRSATGHRSTRQIST